MWMTSHTHISDRYLYYYSYFIVTMKSVKPFSTDSPTVKQLTAKVNRLVLQTNEQKDEIRELKTRLRRTARPSA